MSRRGSGEQGRQDAAMEEVEDDDDPTQVLERERSGGAGGGGGGHAERSHGIDPRELAPFLNALDQYNPTVCWVRREAGIADHDDGDDDDACVFCLCM